jgi:RNA polymerase sigma-70 factor (ECF subfamily)
MPTITSANVSITVELAELTHMRMLPAEEAELIARAQKGDVEAFCKLAASHQRSLYMLALKYSGNHHDAEDLTQEVMLNAYRSIRQFKGMSSLHTWLARIMVNAFLNLKRKSDPLAWSERRTRTEELFEASLSVSRPIHSSERKVHAGLLAQQVLQTLQSVPERQRLIFLMKHQEGMTCEEIANRMGIAVGTVKKTLFRVVDRLRQRFATRVAVRSTAKG